MFKFKVLKYAFAATSLVAFGASFFSDSLRQKTLHRYDLRWCQELDTRNRVQTIVVQNAGNQPKENLELELDFGSDVARVLADFEVSSSRQGPYETFLDVLQETTAQWSSAALTASELNRISQALDKHSAQRGLYDLDLIFDDILRTRLVSGNGQQALQYLQLNPLATQEWHLSWQQKCFELRDNTDCLRVNSILADWEQAKQSFRNAAFARWNTNTSLKLESTSDQLSLDQRLLMKLSLGVNEHRVLRFYYSHRPATVSTSFRSTTGAQTTLLNSVQEVFSPFVSVLFKIHPIWLYIGLVLAALVVYYSALLLPLHLLPIEKIFNFALESRDDDYWKHALDRHRFFIMREFRQLRRDLNPGAKIDSDEVMDFVRDGLQVEHDRGAVKFRNAKALNRSIHDELWQLLTAI